MNSDRDLSRAIELGRTRRVMQIVHAMKMLNEAMTQEEQKQYPVIPQLLELIESHVEK
jgi:hypothetical protein